MRKHLLSSAEEEEKEAEAVVPPPREKKLSLFKVLWRLDAAGGGEETAAGKARKKICLQSAPNAANESTKKS